MTGNTILATKGLSEAAQDRLQKTADRLPGLPRVAFAVSRREIPSPETDEQRPPPANRRAWHVCDKRTGGS